MQFAGDNNFVSVVQSHLGQEGVTHESLCKNSSTQETLTAAFYQINPCSAPQDLFTWHVIFAIESFQQTGINKGWILLVFFLCLNCFISSECRMLYSPLWSVESKLIGGKKIKATNWVLLSLILLFHHQFAFHEITSDRNNFSFLLPSQPQDVISYLSCCKILETWKQYRFCLSYLRTSIKPLPVVDFITSLSSN